MKSTLGDHAVPIGIDILGLGKADQARIRQIGLWAWMDEIAERPRQKQPGEKPSRYSLEYRQARMKRREAAMVRRGRRARSEHQDRASSQEDAPRRAT